MGLISLNDNQCNCKIKGFVQSVRVRSGTKTVWLISKVYFEYWHLTDTEYRTRIKSVTLTWVKVTLCCRFRLSCNCVQKEDYELERKKRTVLLTANKIYNSSCQFCFYQMLLMKFLDTRSGMVVTSSVFKIGSKEQSASSLIVRLLVDGNELMKHLSSKIIRNHTIKKI